MESSDHITSIPPVIYWISSQLDIDELKSAVLHFGINETNKCTEEDLGWIRVYHTKSGESKFSVALMTVELYEGVLDSIDQEKDDIPFTIQPYRIRKSDYPIEEETNSVSISIPKNLSCDKVENAIGFSLKRLEEFGICNSSLVRVDILRESRESKKQLGVAYIHFGSEHSQITAIITRILLRDLPFCRLMENSETSSNVKINCYWAEDRGTPESSEKKNTGNGPLIRYRYPASKKKHQESHKNPVPNGHRVETARPKPNRMRQPAPIGFGRIPAGLSSPQMTSSTARPTEVILPQMEYTAVPANIVLPQREYTAAPANIVSPQREYAAAPAAPANIVSPQMSAQTTIRLPLAVELHNGQIRFVPLTE